MGDFTREWGKEAAEKIITSMSGSMPDAIVCANDLIAVGVIGRLRAGGIRVPRDISVTGFDNIELCRFIEPPISTVHQPLDIIGAEATKRLFARIDGHVEYASHIRILPELIIRSSSHEAAASS